MKVCNCLPHNCGPEAEILITGDPTIFQSKVALVQLIGGVNLPAIFKEAVRTLKKTCPYALTSGGVSNISFSFRGNNVVREAMHSAFLYHAIKAGLDMGIVNAGMLEIYENIKPDLLQCVEDVLLNRTKT